MSAVDLGVRHWLRCIEEPGMADPRLADLTPLVRDLVYQNKLQWDLEDESRLEQDDTVRGAHKYQIDRSNDRRVRLINSIDEAVEALFPSPLDSAIPVTATLGQMVDQLAVESIRSLAVGGVVRAQAEARLQHTANAIARAIELAMSSGIAFPPVRLLKKYIADG